MPKLDPAKPLSRSVPELARHHLDAAIEQLDEQRNGIETAVHQARKHLKRVRALIRLVEHTHPRHFKPIRRALSEAARGLSEVRDATALIECADSLRPYLEARNAGDMAQPLKEAVERRRDLLALEAPSLARLTDPVIEACRKAASDIDGAAFGHREDARSCWRKAAAETTKRRAPRWKSAIMAAIRKPFTICANARRPPSSRPVFWLRHGPSPWPPRLPKPRR